MKHFFGLLKKVILIEELRPSKLAFNMVKFLFIVAKGQLCWLLLLTAFASKAQSPRADLSQVDWQVQQVGFATPDSLAHQLTHTYTTDLQKVRAIFRWIADNIAYNVVVYPRTPRNRGFKQTIEEPYDSVVESKSLNERVAYTVLRNKTALCNGYARLFKTLCDYAGIPSEIITGYARTNIGSSKFRSNHTWNAVFIDGTWHLLDVTWASGFLSYRGDAFIREFNEYYFLTPPEQMIRSHYPEDQRWTLLSNPPVQREYRQAPFRPTAFIKYTIRTYKPATGLVEASLGDTLLFELETADVERDQKIAQDGYYDSTLLAGNTTSVFLQPTIDKVAPKTTYKYIVTSSTVAYLNLLYNKDVVLRYRLQVRSAPAETNTMVTMKE